MWTVEAIVANRVPLTKPAVHCFAMDEMAPENEPDSNSITLLAVLISCLIYKYLLL